MAGYFGHLNAISDIDNEGGSGGCGVQPVVERPVIAANEIKSGPLTNIAIIPDVANSSTQSGRTVPHTRAFRAQGDGLYRGSGNVSTAACVGGSNATSADNHLC